MRRRTAVVVISVISAILFLTLVVSANYVAVPSNAWVAANPLTTARAGATATLMSDGRVLVAGGFDSSGNPVTSVEIYNADASVSAGPPMNVARANHAAIALYDDDILVTGGITTAGGSATNSAEIFDPVHNTWTQLPAMKQPRTGHTISQLLTGDVLLAGGTNSSGPVSLLETFDENTNSFAAVGTLATPRANHAAAVLNDGRVMIVGGTTVAGDGSTQTLASTEIFDPMAGTVTAGSSLITPRSGHSATTVLDGRVIVIGGTNPAVATNGAPAELASAEIFDPLATTPAFTQSASQLTTARTGHLAFLLPNNFNILIVGGTFAGAQLFSAELYTPWTDTFQPTGSMAATRASAAGTPMMYYKGTAGIDGLLLVVGGQNVSDGPLVSGELYGFATVKTDKSDYAPGTTVNITGSGWKPGETVNLTFRELPNIDTPGPYTVVADGNGNISDSEFAPDANDINVRFYLNAVGQTSGLQAQNTFTDSVTSVTITSPTHDSPVTITSLPKSVTVNFNYVTSSTGITTGQADILGTTLTGTKNLTPGTGSDSITITVPAGTANGAYNVKVTVTNSTGSGSNNKNDNQNVAVIINVPTDTTPPIITPSVVGTPGNNEWYTSNVAVSWTVTDSESSITSSSGCGTTNITADTTGANLTCTATSAGGTSSQSVTIKRDATPPTGVSGAARNPDHNGWYNAAVPVTFSGTDSTSGIANCTTTNYSGPDTASASVLGHCTDYAGNTGADVPFNFKFDSTAPTAVALSATVGTPGVNGWYTSDVTVHTSGTETVSTPLSCTADQIQTIETAGQAFNGSCTNDAGLTTNASALIIKLDKTGPTAALSVTAGTLGDNSWYTSDVTVHTAGSDTISNPVTCTADQSQSTETTGALFNGSCTNDAGLKTDAAPLTIKLDKTPPSVTLAVSAGTAGTNGWYTSDVTVHTSGSDAVSGIQSCDPDQHQTTETASAVFNGSCKNGAGLTGNATALTVKLDKTGPTATLAVSAGTLGDNGWYVSDVTVHAAGTDSVSSPVTCTADQILTTDSTGHDFSGSCTNDAGLSTNATDLTVKLDKTPPTVHITPDREADHNGWYNHSLTFTNPGTDSTSGIASCTTPSAYPGPDSAVASVSAKCTDNAGNTATDSFTFMFDATAPTSVSGAPNRAADHNGWYNHAVDVVFTGNDPISRIEACSTVNYAAPDTTTASVMGHCTDVAGNSSVDVASSSFKFDVTPPTAALAVTAGTLGANGWYTSNVTMSTSGTDTVSNPTVCWADQFQTAETTGTAFAGECTNDAGLSTNAASLSVKLDKTPPTAVTLTASGTMGQNNWYTTDVAIKTSGSENVSNPIACTADQSQTTDTTAQVFHGSCTNDAGLSANASDITIKRDATPPVLSGTPTPGPNGYGWNNVDVTVNFTCSDATSGVGAGPSTPQVVSTEGTAQSRSADCSDLAGNHSHATVSDINIDKTPPTISASILPLSPAATGWYNISTGRPTVSFSCGDNLSGVVSCTLPMLVGEGANQTIPGTAMDKAGNSASTSIMHVNVDVTAPTINLVNPSNGGSYVLNQSAAANYNCADTGSSGVATCAGPVANGANFGTNPVGAHSFTVIATDAAGNPATPLTYNYSVLYSTGPCLGDLGHTILQPIMRPAR